MKTIHWLGVGLSSIPGIRRLASKDYNLTVWNRTLSKAENSINHVKSPNVKAKSFDLSDLEKSIKENDIIISQLSTNMHFEIAKLCLKKKCNFVTSSYISPEIRELDKKVKELGLVFLNEIGLDPGIDHFFSHLLVQNLKSKNLNNISVSYKSYCGGFPAVPNDFKYKFSWAPVGVIKALNNNAKFISNSKLNIVTPYKNIESFKVNHETYEAYPNRDSTPYIKEYKFDPKWEVKEFVRGTLRLNGWKKAWSEIFNMLDKKSSDLEDRIAKKSEELWINNQYLKNEEDRVVLYVNLQATQDGEEVFTQSFFLDEKGSGENTAMGKLVSITLSAAIDLMLQNKLQPGIQAATSDKNMIDYFFKILSDYSIKINKQ
ncbi:MAG: hypothetical protein CFH18_00262 [Alphaproteobacteria bacterium MarineAlpha5_Bin8]|nr:MAG: hypothetical protein CFH17_00522 [Alphaproteobacteria bacterium MarineAlpha5_Bin7]PPR48118.1 MAG: hypothetical protein CFH18_00262 [Alphaproteobacteria bacterium MarineAlpha5_Bin8]PPR54304.1 MAG: hypothetical protein CFH16_00488 [Alphaproteobacteria bacterium MarineAlpha5_Bin6]|tara:strand:- start:4169 stop:5290 length:1122 start_codon:yes stop_codon:yes gene_type:complete